MYTVPINLFWCLAMTDIFVLFDTNKTPPTAGSYLVETAYEQPIIFDRGKSSIGSGKHYVKDTGLGFRWLDSGFDGFIFVNDASPDACPEELLDLYDPKEHELCFVAPFYYTNNDNTYDYLLVEMLEPLPYDIESECIPVTSLS